MAAVEPNSSAAVLTCVWFGVVPGDPAPCAEVEQHGVGTAGSGSDSGRGRMVSTVQLYVIPSVENEESGGVHQQQPVAV